MNHRIYNQRCDCCGKLFYIGDRGAYAYKHFIYKYKNGKFLGYDKVGYFCSWSCLRKMEKKAFIYEVKE